MSVDSEYAVFFGCKVNLTPQQCSYDEETDTYLFETIAEQSYFDVDIQNIDLYVKGSYVVYVNSTFNSKDDVSSKYNMVSLSTDPMDIKTWELTIQQFCALENIEIASDIGWKFTGIYT